MTSRDLIIFDCDGVLVDSESIANEVLASALAEIGLPLGYDRTRKTFVGRSLPSCLEIIERELGRAAPENFLDELQARTFERFRRELQPVPGVVEALEQISLPVCVASSGDHAKMRTTLGLTGLLPRFEGRLFSAEDVERGKPAPDLFLHAARTLGAESARCAVIEDSVPGVRAGKAAGMVVFGYSPRESSCELQDEGVIVFDDMRSLPLLLAQAT